MTPKDLATALRSTPAAQSSWEQLAPAVRRGFVKSVLDAKKPETRTRRISKLVETLSQGVPARRTWSPAPKRR